MLRANYTIFALKEEWWTAPTHRAYFPWHGYSTTCHAMAHVFSTHNRSPVSASADCLKIDIDLSCETLKLVFQWLFHLLCFFSRLSGSWFLCITVQVLVHELMTSGSSEPGTPCAPLAEALQQDDLERFEQLLDAGENPAAARTDPTLPSLLHLAAHLDRATFLASLVSRHPPLCQNQRGETPLHIAASRSSTGASIELLVAAYGPDATRDADGRVFVHRLLRNSRMASTSRIELLERILMLPEVQALLNIVDRRGRTVFDTALHRHRDQPALIRLLLQYSAMRGESLREAERTALQTDEEIRRRQLCDTEAQHRAYLRRSEAHSAARTYKFLRRVGRLRKRTAKTRTALVQQEERDRRLLRGFVVQLHQLAARQNVEVLEATEWDMLTRWRRTRTCVTELERLEWSLLQAWYNSRRVLLLTEALQFSSLRQRCAVVSTELMTRRALWCEEDKEFNTMTHSRLRGLEEARLAEKTRRLEEERAVRVMQRVGRGCLQRRGMPAAPPPPSEGSSDGGREDVDEIPLLAATMAGFTFPAEVNAASPSDNEGQDVGERSALDDGEGTDATASERRVEVVQAFLTARALRLRFLRWRAAVRRIEDFWLKRRRVMVTVLHAQSDARSDYSMLSESTRLRLYQQRILRTTRSVTKLLWRENFCCEMTRMLFQAKSRREPKKPAPSRLAKVKALQASIAKYLLLAQFVISCLELIYMAAIPRTRSRNAHNNADVAFCCLELLIALALPLSVSSVLDVVVALSALVCAARKVYGGAIAVTLYVLKVPYVVQAFKSDHPGTNTYCRAINNVTFYLFVLSPLFFGITGLTIRFSSRNSLLLSSDGNVGSVFYYLSSTVAAQMKLVALIPNNIALSRIPEALRRMRNTERIYTVDGSNERLMTIEKPLFMIMLFHMSLSIYLWTAAIVGTHSAIKTHYDISDKTKLKRNQLRFRSHQESEPLDAHRAANIETLGDVLDGAMMENDVQSAKEAIDASYESGRSSRFRKHLTAHTESASYRKHQRKSVNRVPPVTVLLNDKTWDCRKEDPRSAGAFDTSVIEVALGKMDQKGVLEAIVERQLTGHFFRRESSYAMLAMVALEAVFPNTYEMECAFGGLLLLELLVTLYALDLEVLCSNILLLFIRILGVAVGLIPVAIPLAGVRALRLFEGWSSVFQIPGMILWDLGYCLITFLTVWMISFVSTLQFLDSHSAEESICSSPRRCIGISLREVTLSAWTATHIRPTEEGPIMMLMITFFQNILIPFFLTFMLHPLLRLSSFIGRFLRLVIQALHSDLLDYLKHYFEGESWYAHWRFYEPVPAKVIVRLKLWASSCRSKFHKPFLKSNSRYYSTSRVDSAEKETEFTALNEVISSGRFATLAECHPPSKRTKIGVKAIMYLRRSFVCAYTSVGVNILSLVLLFVVVPWGSPHVALVVIAVLAHVGSVVVDLINLPMDLTAVLTILSTVSLLLSTVLLVLPLTEITELYELRYISLIRITQLNVYPFSAVRFFLKPYVLSLVSILLPTLALGVLVYTAELLRAQIYLMANRHKFDGANETTLTYAQKLASRAWHNTSYPNTKEVRELFMHYFAENAFMYYAILNQWLLPTMCISTCLAYLYWSGSNFMDSNLRLIELIPLLEDPITTARFHARHTSWKWIGIISLIASLIFNCLFSPLSDVANGKGETMYFSMEIVFTSAGLFHAFHALRSALHRCIRSSDNLRFQRQNFSRLVLVGEAIMLLCVIAELLYYSLVLPVAVSLLCDPSSCTIPTEVYATYLVSLRFLFLLKYLPRPFLLCLLRDFLLFLYGAVVMVLFFVGATSAVTDITVLRLHQSFSISLWGQAFQSFMRSTFTYAIPDVDSSTWAPFNATDTYERFMEEGRTYDVTTTRFSMSLMLLLLTVAGKVISASTAGFFIAISLEPLSTLYGSPLPPKSRRLYWALSGGVTRIIDYGLKQHPDIKPDVREGVQMCKFSRLYNSYGIPYWTVPHLLEELNICRPARQRRFMFSLEQLLVYLPIAEERRKRVDEFVMQLDIHRGGGPTKLSFNALPTFPPANPDAPSPNPYSGAGGPEAGRAARFVSPLRLVQAVALFELSFPTDSSVKTKHWIEFVAITQKIRAATLMQSLWRMYVQEVLFDLEHSAEERSTIEHLRRKFRLLRTKENVQFRLHSTFSEALRRDRCAFNPGSGHADSTTPYLCFLRWQRRKRINATASSPSKSDAPAESPAPPAPPTPPPPPPPKEPEPEPEPKNDLCDAIAKVNENLLNKSANDLSQEEAEDLLQLSHNMKYASSLIKNSEYSLRGSWLLVEPDEQLQKFSADLLEEMNDSGLESSSIIYLLIADNQSELLSQTIGVGVLFYEKPQTFSSVMVRTGARFSGYGATPSFFHTWRDAFFKVFPKHVGELVFESVSAEWNKLWDNMIRDMCEGNTGKDSEFFTTMYRERNAKRLAVDMDVIRTREASCQPAHRFAPSMLQRAEELFAGLTDAEAMDVSTMSFIFNTYNTMVSLLLSSQRLQDFLREKRAERRLSRDYLVALHQPFLDTCQQFIPAMWNPAVACRISAYYYQMTNALGGPETIPLMVERGTATAVETYTQEDKSVSMAVNTSEQANGTPYGYLQRCDESTGTLVETHKRKSKYVSAGALLDTKSIQASAHTQDSWTLPKDSIFTRAERATWTNIALPRRDQGTSSVVPTQDQGTNAVVDTHDGSTAPKHSTFAREERSIGTERPHGRDEGTSSIVPTQDVSTHAGPRTHDGSTAPKHSTFAREERSIETERPHGHDQGTSSVVPTQDQGTNAVVDTHDGSTAPKHITFAREERSIGTERPHGRDEGTSSIVPTQDVSTHAGPRTHDGSTAPKHSTFAREERSIETERPHGHDQGTSSVVPTQDQGTNAVVDTHDGSTAPKHSTFAREERSIETEHPARCDQGTSSAVPTRDEGTNAGADKHDNSTVPRHSCFGPEDHGTGTERPASHEQSVSSVAPTHDEGISAVAQAQDHATGAKDAGVLSEDRASEAEPASVRGQGISPAVTMQDHATNAAPPTHESSTSTGERVKAATPLQPRPPAQPRPPVRLPKLAPSSNSSMAANADSPRGGDPTKFSSTCASKRKSRGCLLCTNVENSMALWQKDPELMHAVQQNHHRLVRAVISRYGGQEVKTIGDSFIIAAKNLLDGLKIALGIQMELMRAVPIAPGFQMTPETEGAGNPNCWAKRGLRVRISLEHCTEAVASYDVIKRKYDYYGPSMSRCAQIESVACGGQILMSKDTFEALREDLESNNEPCDAALQSLDRPGLQGGPVPKTLRDAVSFVDIGVIKLRGLQQSTHLVSATPKCLEERKFKNERKRVTIQPTHGGVSPPAPAREDEDSSRPAFLIDPHSPARSVLHPHMYTRMNERTSCSSREGTAAGQLSSGNL
eukprot:gene8625-6057_t